MLEDLLDPDPGTYFKTWELIAPLTWSPDNLVLQLFGDAQVESSMAGIYMNALTLEESRGWSCPQQWALLCKVILLSTWTIKIFHLIYKLIQSFQWFSGAIF